MALNVIRGVQYYRDVDNSMYFRWQKIQIIYTHMFLDLLLTIYCLV